MSLAAGIRLGPYEIVGAVGAGGMGEVYEARDTRLHRRVAIKVLPPGLAEDREFRTRFEREARVISSLSHPNICTLYDVGQDVSSGDFGRPVDYLVLEFVEGESLAARIHRGALPPAQVLAIGAQLADALAAAHRAGIVHRDVKPANIVLTKTGVKLLDFGIAKPRFGNAPAQTMIPTMPPEITSRGSFVGTPNYMAPEQLEGEEPDPRSDVFALGAVIYELATGRRAFDGKTQASVIASILAHDPPPISDLQPLSPRALDRIVRKCLEKDPDLRWQSAADLATELKWAEEYGGRTVLPGARGQAGLRRTAWRWLPALVAAVLFAASFSISRLASQPKPAPPVRAFIPSPSDITFVLLGDQGGAPAITRDGRALVAVGYRGGRRMLFVRALNDTTIQAVPGSEDATFPFWSPDGKSIGFFANGQLKRVDLIGGEVISLASAGDGRGGAWGEGFILYTPNIRDGIYRVSADGGQPVQLTKIDPKLHTTHRWPVVLPDNQHFLFFAGNHNFATEGIGIYVGSTTGQPPRFLVATNSAAICVPGYLLYTRGRTLLAQPFDTRRLALTGAAVPLADVTVDSATWNTIASSSESGVLAYETGGNMRTVLTWYDRSGRTLAKLGDAFDALSESVSPDTGRLAVIQMSGGPAPDVWIYDLRTNQGRRLTFGGGADAYSRPVWSPAGDRVAFASRRDPTAQGRLQIYVKRADGSGGEELLFKGDRSAEPTDWSRDGRYLILNRGEVAPQAVWVMPLFGDRRPFALLKATADYDHCDARLSPDGRWIAYSSSETGAQEIFVTSFPDAAGKWQVSSGGGALPQWRADGKELFFITADSQIAAASTDSSGTTLDIGPVRRLFRAPILAVGSQWASYAITPDGQRFVLPAAQESQSTPITVWTNWPSAIGR